MSGETFGVCNIQDGKGTGKVGNTAKKLQKHKAKKQNTNTGAVAVTLRLTFCTPRFPQQKQPPPHLRPGPGFAAGDVHRASLSEGNVQHMRQISRLLCPASFTRSFSLSQRRTQNKWLSKGRREAKDLIPGIERDSTERGEAFREIRVRRPCSGSMAFVQTRASLKIYCRTIDNKCISAITLLTH